MKEIEDTTVVDGVVTGENLILTRRDATQINAGSVRGPQGVQGPIGEVSEAPQDGKSYIRKNGLWVPGVEESSLAGSAVRRDNQWVDAPGLHLGHKFNGSALTTSSSLAQSFAGGGTALTVAVTKRGVTVDCNAYMSHTDALRFIHILLYVDGVRFGGGRGDAVFHVVVAGQWGELYLQTVFAAGELSVGTHTFEVKGKQDTASTSMTLQESQISIRRN
jgi:hypothetical protein